MAQLQFRQATRLTQPRSEASPVALRDRGHPRLAFFCGARCSTLE